MWWRDNTKIDVLEDPEEFREALKSPEMRAAEDPKIIPIVEDWELQLEKKGHVVATRRQYRDYRLILARHGTFILPGSAILFCGEVVRQEPA